MELGKVMRDPLLTVRVPHKERKGLCSLPNRREVWGPEAVLSLRIIFPQNRPKFRATWVQLPFLPQRKSLKKTLRHPQIPFLLSFPPFRSPDPSPTAKNPD